MRADSRQLEEDPDMDLDGLMEDDWQSNADVEVAPASAERLDEGTPALDPEREAAWERMRQRLGIGDEEAELYDRAADALVKDGVLPDDLRKELAEHDNKSSLDSFDQVIGTGAGGKWIPVLLNETLVLTVAQVYGALDRVLHTFRTEPEVNEKVEEVLTAGDTVWPGAVILARWLAIHPPIVPLQGKSVIELGAGLGVPGVVAARLGAARVLLQDRNPNCLREAMETAQRNGVIEQISTLRCDWNELPAQLLAASEEILQGFVDADVFLGSDVLFSEEAAAGVADVLAQLLRLPGQVAYIADPYKKRNRRAFRKLCKASSLETTEAEIVTWEPDRGMACENNELWVCVVITVRRM